MKWFFEIHQRRSEKNGLIVVRRLFGRWTVFVNGCEQTGPVVHRMWQNAFQKTLENSKAKTIHRVLALGLGAGGEIKNIYTHFPNVEITVVEHDPEMVTLAKELGLHRPFPLPTVKIGDAKDVVLQLDQHFDLIILDLFNGPEPSPLVRDEYFLKILKEKLTDNGLLVANIYRKIEYVQFLAERFPLIDTWKFEFNTLALFEKTQKTGKRLLAFPTGYSPPQLWPEFNLSAVLPKFMRPAFIGTNPTGIYSKVWPFSFEEYISNTEPEIGILDSHQRVPLRVIRWKRLAPEKVPSGWYGISQKFSQVTGIARIPHETPYWMQWSETARRHRRQWLDSYLGTHYTIERITSQEFKDAYFKSTLTPFTRKTTWNDGIRPRINQNPDSIVFWGGRRICDREILSGIAVIDSLKHRGSYYLAGFYRKEVGKDPVMTGLFDHWFKESRQQSINYIDFGNFWKKGDPKAWKGFSQFKSKFGVQYIKYQPTLYKFIRG